jgi:hypothetical protein
MNSAHRNLTALLNGVHGTPSFLPPLPVAVVPSVRGPTGIDAGPRREVHAECCCNVLNSRDTILCDLTQVMVYEELLPRQVDICTTRAVMLPAPLLFRQSIFAMGHWAGCCAVQRADHSAGVGFCSPTFLRFPEDRKRLVLCPSREPPNRTMRNRCLPKFRGPH